MEKNNCAIFKGQDPHMKTQEYFEISDEEYMKADDIFVCKNNEFFREKTGISIVMKALEEKKETKNKKTRIIVDYDESFPEILTRIIFR